MSMSRAVVLSPRDGGISRPDMGSARNLLVYACFALVVVFTACCPAARLDKLPADAYPGELRAPAELGANVMWRQKVTAKWGKSESRSFVAVLQKQGERLSLLGLSPMG